MFGYKKVDNSLLRSIMIHKEDIRVQGIQIWPLVGMFGEISVAIPLIFIMQLDILES